LPVQSNVIKNITQTKLTVIKDREEERAIPNNAQLDEMEYNNDKDAADGPQKSAKKDSEDSFCKMDRQSLKDAESYTMLWGGGKDDVVVWRILRDGESVLLHEDTFVLPDKVEYKLDVTEEELDDPTDFFSIYFPGITGK
jgi:hypothetical protein